MYSRKQTIGATDGADTNGAVPSVDSVKIVHSRKSVLTKHKIIMSRPLPDQIDFTRPQELYRQDKRSSNVKATDDKLTDDVDTQSEVANDSASTTVKTKKHRIIMVRPLQNPLDLTKTQEEMQKPNIGTTENDKNATSDNPETMLEDKGRSNSDTKGVVSPSEGKQTTDKEQPSLDDGKQDNERESTDVITRVTSNTYSARKRKRAVKKPRRRSTIPDFQSTTKPDFQSKIDETNEPMTSPTDSDFSLSRPKRRVRGPRAHILMLQQSVLFDYVKDGNSQAPQRRDSNENRNKQSTRRNKNGDKCVLTAGIPDPPEKQLNGLGQPIIDAFVEVPSKRLNALQYIRNKATRLGVYLRKRLTNLCCSTRVSIIQTM